MGKMMILFTCWMIGWLIVTMIVVLLFKRSEEREDTSVPGKTEGR